MDAAARREQRFNALIADQNWRASLIARSNGVGTTGHRQELAHEIVIQIEKVKTRLEANGGVPGGMSYKMAVMWLMSLMRQYTDTYGFEP